MTPSSIAFAVLITLAVPVVATPTAAADLVIDIRGTWDWTAVYDLHTGPTFHHAIAIKRQDPVTGRVAGSVVEGGRLVTSDPPGVSRAPM